METDNPTAALGALAPAQAWGGGPLSMWSP